MLQPTSDFADAVPFCTEKADFVQSIYQIYSFVTGHVYKLFLWINQSIPCTITNFADRYSEILNWISYLNIISELPCWSISELVLSTHQNMMYQQDFVALKIRLYCYALKKQYKCKSYSWNLLFCLSKCRKLWILVKTPKNKIKSLSSKPRMCVSTAKHLPINSCISNQSVHPKNYYGGHQTRVFSYDFLEPYLTPGYPNTLDIIYILIMSMIHPSLCILLKILFTHKYLLSFFFLF